MGSGVPGAGLEVWVSTVADGRGVGARVAGTSEAPLTPALGVGPGEAVPVSVKTSVAAAEPPLG